MRINIHHRHHITADAGVLTRLDLIISKLDLIMTKEERLIQLNQDLNTATNDIAADLQTLKDQIAAGNVSEETLTQLEANIEALKAVGNAQ